MAEKLIRLPQLQTFKQQADLKYQDKLTAGSNITITDSTISATDTTYSDATTASAGLMSSTDKVKLNGIESGANNYTLPTASTGSLGGVKVGTNLSIDSNGVLTAAQPVFGQQTLYNATITAAGWSGTSNTVTVQGIAAGDDVEIAGINPTGLTDQQILAAKNTLGLITYGTTSANAITFYALDDVPSVDIPVTIRKIINLSSSIIDYSSGLVPNNTAIYDGSNFVVSLVKQDRICIISGYVRFRTESAADTTLFTVPTGALPSSIYSSATATILGEITGDNTARNCQITTAGVFRMHNSATPASGYMRFNGCYISET